MHNVDTGKVYEITSEGISNGVCYDGGLAVDDISASTYNIHTKQLWSRYESQETISVIDTIQDCTVATYELQSEYDEEGLVIDWEKGYMYIVTDGQG